MALTRKRNRSDAPAQGAFPAAVAMALALVLAGCSTPKALSEHDVTVDFSRFKTFAVLPLSTAGPGADPGAVLRLARPVEQTVRETLTAKGFTPAERDSADMAVRVRGESLPRIEIADWGNMPPYGGWYYGWPYYGGYRRVDVWAYEDRRLVVEIRDNSSRQVVWIGWLDSYGSGLVKPEKAQEGVRKILEKFPPASNKP